MLAGSCSCWSSRNQAEPISVAAPPSPITRATVGVRSAVTNFGQTVVMVTHDPAAAAYASRVLFLADGQIVDELMDPTRDSVLERMRTLGN